MSITCFSINSCFKKSAITIVIEIDIGPILKGSFDARAEAMIG